MSRIRLWIIAAVGVLLIPAHAFAGWICIKNETKTAVYIQDVPDGPGLKRGKVVRLLPGETYREFHLCAGEKKVQVFDATNPTAPLCETRLTWPAADVSLHVFTDKKTVTLGPVKVETAGATMVLTGSSSAAPAATQPPATVNPPTPPAPPMLPVSPMLPMPPKK
ncbi:hypothetical protein [Fimbriiglobus ruber]|uniref:hypothetical protein n=1 Tax=Fimbriiglobus ruber TaxID=1908690 RepID=UPI00117A2A83|nr:hypothetical protein [Fimbriiglobus ruber]